MEYLDLKFSCIYLLMFYFLRVGLSENIHLVLSEDENVLKPKLEYNRYKPNTIMSWHIIPSSKRKASMIQMTVKYVDVDDYAGDYVLLGGSSTSYGNMSDVFGGPPPLLLTGKQTKEYTVLITTDTAYVVLVSKSPKRMAAAGFEILYQRSGESVPSGETESPKYDLWNNAVSLCVKVSLNISEMQVKNDVTTIVSKLAERYIKIKRTRLQIKISDSDIHVLKYAKRKDCSFYFLLSIARPDEETEPLFTSEELKEILYDKNHDDQNLILLNKYQFVECLKAFEDQVEIKIILATIPVFFIFFLFVWWWTYNRFWSSRFKDKEDIKYPLKMNIEMYPPQVSNPIFQPDSPTSLNECEGKSDFPFPNTSPIIKRELCQTDSSASWSPQQSAWRKKMSRKNFNVSFAIPPKNHEDTDDDTDSVASSTTPKAVTSETVTETKL